MKLRLAVLIFIVFGLLSYGSVILWLFSTNLLPQFDCGKRLVLNSQRMTEP